MKQLKFRGMPYSRSCFISFDLKTILEARELPIDLDPSTIEQDTGFKDCNDTSIYSGDILVFYSPTNGVATIRNTAPVTFFEGGFILLKLNEEPMALRDVIKCWGKYGNIEIIGNIYENPELLN